MVQAELHGVTITHRFITIFVKKRIRISEVFFMLTLGLENLIDATEFKTHTALKDFFLTGSSFFPKVG